MFRLRPGTKEPFHGSRGFKDASTDPDRVREWWRESPEANVGIPTGARTRFVVVDVDTYKPGAWSREDVGRELGPLTATLTARTGSGGLQFYYRLPAGEILKGIPENVLGPGVCVKAEGGYVVAPHSRTTGPDDWIAKSPVADAPAWLLEALRAPSRTKSGAARHRTVEGLAAGDLEDGPLPEGSRNAGLTRSAGKHHDGSRDLAGLGTELLEHNARRCFPPLPEGEVLKIAASIHRRPPCKETTTATPEVLEVLRGIEKHGLWRSWKGGRWKSPRSVLVALIKAARRHGTGTDEGVRVSISVRDLTLAAALGSPHTTLRALERLTEAGMVKRDGTERRGPKAGTLVLIAPRAKLHHSSTGRRSSEPTVAPLRAPRLRWNVVRRERVGDAIELRSLGRLGKTAENVVDVLERAGGELPVRVLADELGLSRTRDLRRRSLARLEGAAVVECSPEGDVVRLSPDWLAALETRREQDEELADLERYREKFAAESRWYREGLKARELSQVADPAEIAVELGIGLESVRAHLGLVDRVEEPVEPVLPAGVDGFVEDLEPVEELPTATAVVEAETVSPLVVALRDYLRINPHRRTEPASWLAVTLWAEKLVDGKPTREEVAGALLELESIAKAA